MFIHELPDWPGFHWNKGQLAEPRRGRSPPGLAGWSHGSQAPTLILRRSLRPVGKRQPATRIAFPR
jgi:hypothetical protein